MDSQLANEKNLSATRINLKILVQEQITLCMQALLKVKDGSNFDDEQQYEQAVNGLYDLISDNADNKLKTQMNFIGKKLEGDTKGKAANVRNQAYYANRVSLSRIKFQKILSLIRRLNW